MSASLASAIRFLQKYPLNDKWVDRLRANHEAGRHNSRRPGCPLCYAVTGLAVPEPKRTLLYPEREEVRCERCGCYHWRPGRCFADDPKFLELKFGQGSRMRSLSDVGLAPRTRSELERLQETRASQLRLVKSADGSAGEGDA